MSCNASATNSELRTFNKSRRKRKRTKCKGYSTKKSQKTVCSGSKQFGSVQTNFLKRRKSKDALFIPLNSKKIMSTWYWANYNKALAWRSKHKVAHWKAYALALQHENKYLLEIIKELDPGQKLNIHHTNQDLEESSMPEKVNKIEFANTNLPSTSGSTSNVCGDNELQFEMSEEMIKFFEQSFKHKMDLKKVREEAEKKADGDRFIKESQKARLQREEEMKSLYGDGASMIVGMETAVQLSYERYCDIKSPKYWPNIPLRL